MHILVTADTLGGVWTYARELVTELAKRGVRVTLVSFGDIPERAQTNWMAGLEGLDFRPTGFKLEWMQNSAADMEVSAEYLSDLVRETKPDILHLNQYFYGALDCDVPRLVVAHSDVVSWWWAVHQSAPPESEWLQWYREIVRRGLSSATAVAAPSRWMLQQVTSNYVQPRAASVVYNGRNAALFQSHAAKQESIVSVGRLWDSGKNAALLLRDEMPAPVYIVGAGRHPESNSGAFQVEEIRSNIHLEPQKDEADLAGLLSRAAVYAATSQYEPFGLAPLEAALSRCAIVASDIPSFRELWDGAALFFRPNEAHHLRETLEYLMQHPEVRQEYADLAFDRARTRFSSEKMVDQYLRLYKELVPAHAV